MKIVILAGGFPSTIAEESSGIPKPMAEIGGQPILWHIMKYFSFYGFQDFIICGGYKVNMLKDYFKDYYIYQSDIVVDLRNNALEIVKNVSENWKVSVVDTGLYSSTGRRVSLVGKYIDEEEFIVIHGDCLSNVNPRTLVEYHRTKGKLVTMMVANPTGRHSVLEISEDGIYQGNCLNTPAWVNAYTYVMNRKIFDYLLEDRTLEMELQPLAAKKQIVTYKHNGFWTPVETKRDHQALEESWAAGKAPWKIWED